MGSRHKILTDMGIRLDEVYPEGSRSDEASIDKYGLPYGYFYHVDWTLAAFLIELLSLYKENSQPAIFGSMYPREVEVYIPKAKKRYVHFRKEYKYDKKFSATGRQKRTIEYRKGFSGVSLYEAVCRVIKACRLYLCNNADCTADNKYCMKKYRQYCKRTRKNVPDEADVSLSMIASDMDYADCIEDEFRYGLKVLSYIIVYLYEE